MLIRDCVWGMRLEIGIEDWALGYEIWGFGIGDLDWDWDWGLKLVIGI